MTFSSVSQALSQGYAISNVIKSVLRMNTPLAKAIKEAMKQGYNEDQIGEYLEKGKTSSYSQKNQMLKGMTEEEKARGIAYHQPKSEKNIGNILKTAAMAAPVAAAGAVAGPMIGSAMGRMAPTAMNALQRAAPQLMGAGAVPGGAQALAKTGVLGNTQQSPQAAQTTQTTGSIPQNSQQPPLNNPQAASIPEPFNIQQPEVISNPKEFLEKVGVIDVVNDHLKRGTSPEGIAALISTNMNKKGKLGAKIDPELLKNIEEYAKTAPIEPQEQQAVEPTSAKLDEAKETKGKEIESPRRKLDKLVAFDEPIYDKHFGKGFYKNTLMKMSEKERENWLNDNADKFTQDDLKKFQEFYKDWNPEDTIENLQKQIGKEEKPVESVKIEKNSIVSSPEGVGEIKEIRNGQALVEIDGKLHKVKEEDLEPPLYSDDEIADAYDNLMAKIPEKERSGFISWAGYDENTNELGFIPRGGKYEVITDISPEEAKMIKEGTGTARTNGEVREGLWIAGGETRGGVISQIIHDRRRKREAEEKKQGKFDFNLLKPEKEDRGMKPQFDEMAYARNLSRAREKKAKDEERARKKKEKDEAKKRKK